MTTLSEVQKQLLQIVNNLGDTATGIRVHRELLKVRQYGESTTYYQLYQLVKKNYLSSNRRQAFPEKGPFVTVYELSTTGREYLQNQRTEGAAKQIFANDLQNQKDTAQ